LFKFHPGNRVIIKFFSFLLAVYIFIPLQLLAQNYNLENYFLFYQSELDKIVSYSQKSNNYDLFKEELEYKLNMLKAIWEKDRDYIKSKSGADKKSARKVNSSYSEWEKEAERKISEAKASYITEHTKFQLTELKNLREEFYQFFTSKYYELLQKVTDKNDKDKSFNDFKNIMIGFYKQEVSKIGKEVEVGFENLKNEISTDYPEDSAGTILKEQLETKKNIALYERKVFLTELLNSYIGETYYQLFTDSNSLRAKLEENRARKEAEDLVKEVKLGLDEKVKKRLSALLNKDMLEEKDIIQLSLEVKDLYKNGIDIWARAGAELIKRKQEWYREYDDIYNDGLEAWFGAIDILNEKKDAWVMDFSMKVEKGLEKWNEALSRMDDFKNELLLSFNQYRMDMEKTYESYINHLESTISYGSDSVGQIDGYIEEFNWMIKNILSPMTNKNLIRPQIDSLMCLFDQYEDSFWYPDKSMKDLFNFKTTKIKVSNTSKTDYIKEGPYYYLASSKELDNGFMLKVKVDAVVRRYDKTFILKKLKGFIFTHEDNNESRYYNIICTLDENLKWQKTISYTAFEESGDKVVDINKLNILSISDQIRRYLSIIDSLKYEKSKLLKSINDVQTSFIQKFFEEQYILNAPALIDENTFNEYYFGSNKEIFLNDFDRLLYQAYYEKEFWSNQFNIIEEVLDYALNRGNRKEAEKTISGYEEARAQYTQELSEYENLLISLSSSEQDVDKASELLEASKKELSVKEQDLRQALGFLSKLKVADANLSMLLNTLYLEINQTVNNKHALLEKVFEFNKEKEEEAVLNILKPALDLTKLQYDRIFNNYFDPYNKESLTSMKQYQKSFELIMEALCSQTEGGISISEVERVINELTTLSSELSNSGIYREILIEIKSIENALQNKISLNKEEARWKQEGDPFEEAEIPMDSTLSNTYKNIFTVKNLFDDLIDAKREAYHGLYMYNSNPVEFLNNQYSYVSECYISDSSGYIHRKLEEIAIQKSLLKELESHLGKGLIAEESASEESLEISTNEEVIINKMANICLDFVNEKQDELFNFSEFNFKEKKSLNEIKTLVEKELLLENFAQYLERALVDLTIDVEENIEEIISLFLEKISSFISDDENHYLNLKTLLSGYIPGTPIDDFLIAERENNKDGFFEIKKFFEELFSLVTEERALNFSKSWKEEKKLNFYKNLLIGEKSPNFETAFLKEIESTMVVVQELGNTDIMKQLLGRIESDYYSGRKKDDISPIFASIDHVILKIFKNADELNSNSMLKIKYPLLLKTMADYCASSIFLQYEPELRAFSGNTELLEGLINQ